MAWLVDNFFWILIVSGILNLLAISFAVAPRRAFRSAFGHEMPDDPAVRILARTLGAVVAATGALFIMAAFEQEARFWVLTFACAGKVVFAGQLIAHGRRFGSARARLTAFIDLVMVAIFLAYLAA